MEIILAKLRRKWTNIPNKNVQNFEYDNCTDKKKKQQQNNVQLLIVVIPKNKKKSANIFFISSATQVVLIFLTSTVISHTLTQTHKHTQRDNTHKQTHTYLLTRTHTWLYFKVCSIVSSVVQFVGRLQHFLCFYFVYSWFIFNYYYYYYHAYHKACHNH